MRVAPSRASTHTRSSMYSVGSQPGAWWVRRFRTLRATPSGFSGDEAGAGVGGQTSATVGGTVCDWNSTRSGSFHGVGTVAIVRTGASTSTRCHVGACSRRSHTSTWVRESERSESAT